MKQAKVSKAAVHDEEDLEEQELGNADADEFDKESPLDLILFT